MSDQPASAMCENNEHAWVYILQPGILKDVNIRSCSMCPAIEVDTEEHDRSVRASMMHWAAEEAEVRGDVGTEIDAAEWMYGLFDQLCDENYDMLAEKIDRGKH